MGSSGSAPLPEPARQVPCQDIPAPSTGAIPLAHHQRRKVVPRENDRHAEGRLPACWHSAHIRAVSTCGSTHWTLWTSRVVQMCSRSRRSTSHPQLRFPDASASRAMASAVALSCTSPKSGKTLSRYASLACWCRCGTSAGMLVPFCVAPPGPYAVARRAPLSGTKGTPWRGAPVQTRSHRRARTMPARAGPPSAWDTLGTPRGKRGEAG